MIYATILLGLAYAHDITLYKATNGRYTSCSQVELYGGCSHSSLAKHCPSACMRRGRQLMLETSNENDAELFVQAFGIGLSWQTGVVATDSINLVNGEAKPATVKFGAAQMGSFPVNSLYEGSNPTDGLVGLKPGCFKANPETNKCDKFDDLLSALAEQKALSARAITFCVREDYSGRVYFGKPTKVPPQDATRIPLYPMWNSTTNAPPAYEPGYIPRAIGEGVTLKLGTETVYKLPAAIYDELARKGDIYMDTGGIGYQMNSDAFNALTGAIAKAWNAQPKAVDAFATIMGLDKTAITEATIAGSLTADGRAFFSRIMTEGARQQDIDTLNQATPDAVTDFGDGSELRVPGKTFIFQTTECSGKYSLGWTPNDNRPMMWGPPLMAGSIITYDTSDLTNPVMIHRGAAGDCSDETLGETWSEIKSYAGQAVQGGNLAAEFAFGSPPQKLELQLDTGSQLLITHTPDCMLFAPGTSCQGQSAGGCDVCVSALPTQNPIPAGHSNYTVVVQAGTPGSPTSFGHPELNGPHRLTPGDVCNPYYEPWVKAIKEAAATNYPDFKIHQIVQNGESRQLIGFTIKQLQETAAKTLQPYATCGKTRTVCDAAGSFDGSKSSTFAYFPDGASYTPPIFLKPQEWTVDVKCEVCKSHGDKTLVWVWVVVGVVSMLFL